MHTTRHTYATDLGRATGWNMVAVQKNLGHANVNLTIDTYTQFAYRGPGTGCRGAPGDRGIDGRAGR
jgi:integrase